MKDDPDRNAAALKELLKEDANKHCADCGQLGTRWASWNIGVFLCIRCGGLHRTLGTHISKIKSTTLDRWTDEQVACITARGNARVNAELMPFPERFPFPTLPADQQQYIKDKYERKLFSATQAVKSPIIAVASNNGVLGRPTAMGAERTYSTEIRSMREMGFMDAQACLAALKRTNGNVNAAVDLLFAQEEQKHKTLPQNPVETVQKPALPFEEDPWSRIDPPPTAIAQAGETEKKPAVSPPPYLEDPFADWNNN